MVSNDQGIVSYIHCRKCLEKLPPGESPQSYAQLDIGFTREGLQVWCRRHNCNVMHIDFEGQQHPANLSTPGDLAK